MKQSSCQGGLLMFKKSCAQAIHRKEETPSGNANFRERKKNRIVQHVNNDEGPQAINIKSESNGMCERSGKCPGMKNRGRGQLLDPHDMPIPARGCASFSNNASLPATSSSIASTNTVSNYSVSGAQSTTYTSRTYQDRENMKRFRQRNARCDKPTFSNNRFGNPEQDAGRKPPMRLESQHSKPNKHGRPTLKYRRSQDLALTQSQTLTKEQRKLETNRKLSPEEIISSADKSKAGHSSSTGHSLRNIDTLSSVDDDHDIGPLDKIHDMYKMYEEKFVEEKVTEFGNGSAKRDCRTKQKDSDALCRPKQSHKAESVQSDSDDFYHGNGHGGARESEFVNQRKSFSRVVSKTPVCEADLNQVDTVERLETAVESLSISNSSDIIPDGEVLIIQEEIAIQEQESQSYQTNHEEQSKIPPRFHEAFSAESPTQDNSTDDHQRTITTTVSSEFGTSSEVEVFSQSEGELQESSQEEVNRSQTGSTYHRESNPRHVAHSALGDFHGGQEVYNSQHIAQNESVHHNSGGFHPQFYPNASASHYNYSYSQAFTAGSRNPSLVLPSDGFGSRDSIEMVVDFVTTERRRWEEYAENCYGFCAPLDVVISVRESPMFAKHPYPQPSPFFHPNAYPVPMRSTFYPGPYWRDPAWSNSFAQNSRSSFSEPHHRSMTLHNFGDSSGQRSSTRCHGTVEGSVVGNSVSYEDDTFCPQEIEHSVIGENPVETRCAEETNYSREFCEGSQPSNDESGSCYSTANSDDAYTTATKTGEINCNRDSNAQKSCSKEGVSTKRISARDRVKQMDAKDKGTETYHTANGTTNPVRKDTWQSIYCTPSMQRKQCMHSGGRNSTSNFLTQEHLHNDWTSSSSPSAAKKTHPLRSFLESMSMKSRETAAPYPIPLSSRKRKGVYSQEEYEVAGMEHKGGKLSHKVASREQVWADNKANLSSTSEPSISPNSTSGSSYFSPPWPGAFASHNLNGRTSMSPCDHLHDPARDDHFTQRPRSRSFSSEYNKQLTGASAFLENSAGEQQHPVPSKPRDSQISASPCNHFRRSFDGNDRWKTAFLRRSKSYNHTFIDTHCHIDFLYARTNSSDMTFTEFMAQHSDSFPANYEGCVSVFCNPRTFYSYKPNGNDILNVVAKEKGVWIAAGCHPKNATDFKAEHLDGLLRILKHCPKVVALGEIGLDYSGKFRQFAQVQKQVFRRQLFIALDLKLPLVIHCREADEDCLEILQEIVPRHHKIHAHCFTRDLKMAHRWMSLFPNLYLGLTPLITYKSAQEAIETAAGIPLERLLLETDAPYFVPAGVHLCNSDNKYSHPGLALYTAETVAMLKGIPVDVVLKAARENTHIVYNI